MQAAIRPGSPAPAIGPGTAILIVALDWFPIAVAKKLYSVVTEYGIVMAIAVSNGPDTWGVVIAPANGTEGPSGVHVAQSVVKRPLALS